ncbi:MAG: hypothetical protein AAF085_02095 [Planctomycetota bacterium]
MSTHDDFNELEDMLADLPVREPSQMLDARVASTMNASAPTPSTSRPPWLAIAAAVLLVASVTVLVSTLLNPKSDIDMGTGTRLGFDIPEHTNEADTAPTIQLATNQPEAVNLTWSRDVVDETRYTPAGEPYRAVVREAVDHKAWTDHETGESGQLCVPREELIVVKQTTF